MNEMTLPGKDAEPRLWFAEDRFGTIFDKASDGILIADAESRKFLEVNPAASRMLGYSQEELSGMGVEEIHPAADLAAVLESFSRLARGEISFAADIPFRRKDGSICYADINVSRVRMGDRPCLLGIFRDITERRQAGEELRMLSNRLAESQRIARIGSWEHNLETNQTFWSAELFSLFGLDAAKDKADFDFFLGRIHPADQPRLKKAIEQTLEFFTPYTVDYRFILPDGRVRFFQAMAELVPDSAGRLVVLSGTAQDITERKMAEERVNAHYLMLQTLINAIPDVVIFKDNLGRYQLVNRAMTEAFGKGEEEIIGRTDQEILPPDIAERCSRSDAEAIRTGCPIHAEESYVNGQGETRFLDVVKAPLRDQENTLKGVVVVSRDVTERKQGEEKIQKHEKYIRNILNTVDDGFIVVDRDYRIHSANRAYCDHLGLREDQVVGRCCFEVSHRRQWPCHEEGEECCVREVFARGEPYITCHRHEDAEGNTLYVETKGFPLLDAAGEVILAIETVSDITEKRLLEDERLKVQKLEAIGTLAGGIAHDFNNLLQGVFGYISMAKLSGAENREVVAALEEAEKALQLTVRMSNQLLTFSKGGKPTMHPTDLRGVIENAVRFSLSGSAVHCTVSHADDLRLVDADEGQITQVMQNIVLNAVQAMPGGGEVEVTTRNLPSAAASQEGPARGGGEYVEIAIRDHGEGIGQEILPRIFDPYFTTKKNGSGLGLATSYSIVKNHGGWIQVDSSPGAGTTFRVSLPASESVPQPVPDGTTACEHQRRGRILVMDDEQMICQIASALLTILGHEAETAADGDEARVKYQAALAAGKPFDAVILDLTIRGGPGGTETLEMLRRLDPAVKAVVSTGYADSEIVTRHRDHGFAAVLSKPYDLASLRGVLNTILAP